MERLSGLKILHGTIKAKKTLYFFKSTWCKSSVYCYSMIVNIDIICLW